MAKFRKKPVVIEALQWGGDLIGSSLQAVLNFCPDASCDWKVFPGRHKLTIKTLEGEHQASPGDWIIRGVKGEYYPCKPNIFAATYEEVTSG